LSAGVFCGRRRAAGGYSCRTIFHCTTAARGRAPVLGVASGCLARCGTTSGGASTCGVSAGLSKGESTGKCERCS
jgi:hypothetical protein